VTQSIDLRRRGLLRASGVSVLSASTVALLAGCEKMAVAQSSNTANDFSILNTALALENEAISAYQLGAASGLLQKPVLEVAVLFQTHHKEHRDALIATIRKLGGTPVAAKSDAEVAQALNASMLKSQTDVRCVWHSDSRRARPTPISASSRRSETGRWRRSRHGWQPTRRCTGRC
jgi:hypothetical protein